jgi:hypothetical protein
VLALCNPARTVPIEHIYCSWAASSILPASQYRQAFAGLQRFRLLDTAAHALGSLCAALQEMHQLQQLCLLPEDFESTSFLPAALLDALAEGTTLLRILRTTSFVQLIGSSEGGLCAIAKRNPNLVEVSLLDESWVVTDSVVHALAQNCVNLQHFEAVSAKDVTDSAVVALALNCPRLYKLSLRSCANLTNRSILALAGHCPLLAELDVRDSPRITQSALEQLVRSCPELDKLSVSTASLSAAAAERLQKAIKPCGAQITRTPAPVSMWVAAMTADVVSALSGYWSAAAGVIGGHSAVHPS